MNVLSAEKNSSLYDTDIETGKVVAEWDFEKNGVNIPMKDIVAETKGAPAEERSTFVGLDSNRLCRWDMRDPKGVVQEMSNNPVVEFLSGKDYARGWVSRRGVRGWESPAVQQQAHTDPRVDRVPIIGATDHST